MTSPFNAVMIGAMIFAKHAKPSIGLFKTFLNSPPLLDDHQTEQTRVTNPLLNWLRDVALLVEKKNTSNSSL
jgi:hypothetical protein